MHRQTQALLSQHDMTADQYVLLALLCGEDGITQNELTTRASSDPNTVRAMLVLLEGKGHVVRKPHKSDRRARRVLVTAAGRRKYKKLAEVLKPLQDAMLAPFDEREAERLLESLQRLTAAMRQWEVESELVKTG